jgi:dihydroorotate dehydrogenase (fumarate)
MIDLSTRYLGLDLANPLVPSAGPLTGDFNTARELEDLGAAALVLPSLFEEELIIEQEQMSRFLDHQPIGHPEAETFLPGHGEYQSRLDQYLDMIVRYKQALSIPVIASLNGVTDSGWLEHALDLERAGCDALEINLYDVVFDPLLSSDQVERRYLGIVHHLMEKVKVPVAVKLCPEITALAHFVRMLESAGARGVICFNRFYQPDIDLDRMCPVPRVHLSEVQESWQRIRWISLLRGQTNLSLAASGGFHSHLDVMKALLCGADIVQMCSVLIRDGIERLGLILQRMSQWMEEHEYESVMQLKGSLSQMNSAHPDRYARAHYMQVLDVL